MNDEKEQHSSYFKINLLYQYVAVFTAVLISVCFGMHMGWTSPSLPLLLDKNSVIPTSSSEGSWIVAILFLVQPLGCLLTALVINRIGRKTCILISSPLLFVPWLVIAYAKNVLTIECARVLAGLGSGIMYTALPMYVGEISHKSIRGLLGTSVQVASKIGILAINVIGLQFDIWITAIIASTIPILHFVTFFWMPESPHFLVMRNKNQEAAASLKKLTQSKDADFEMSELTSMLAKSTKHSGRFLDIFTNPINRKSLGVIIGLRLLEHFSGFYAITFYCLIIFNEAGGAVKGSTATVIYLTIQLVMSTLGSAIVDKTGRKPLLIISVIGAGCSLLAEGIYFYIKYKTNIDTTHLGYVPLTALLIYTSTYSIGLTTIPVLLIAEIFPANIKAFAVGFGISIFALLAAVVSKLFQAVKDEYGIHVPFFMFAACCAVGLVFIVYCVPETKGKSLQEIQQGWTASHDVKKTLQHPSIKNT